MPFKVTIGIQARSTSKRLPEKVFEMIGNKSVLRHVVDACQKSAIYINNWNTKKIWVDLALCIPKDDPIKNKSYGEVSLIEGPEDDVLKRYVLVQEKHQSDYIVRITADCPLIPSFVISKCITTAVLGGYDYFSNADARCRTTADGTDCEVVSKAMLKYMDDSATLPSDREHVTTFAKNQMNSRFKYGTIVNFFDLSHLKLSLDTVDDLERIRWEFNQVQKAYEKAESIYGRANVHRF